MTKAWGVIGGFLVGLLVMVVVGLLMYGMMYAMFKKEPFSATEGMTSGGDISIDGASVDIYDSFGPSGSAMLFMGFGYFFGWIVSVYLGYGFSYDTGYADCKSEK